MGGNGRRFGRVTALLVWALPGCHFSPPAPPETVPAALSRSVENPAGDYSAWRRHTEGAAGEDLYPVPHADAGLLFSSNRHGAHYKLYARRPTGRALQRLTHGPGHDLYLAVAPDLRRLVFTSTRDGAPRLYLMSDLSDQNPKRIGDADADAVHPSWSPDGTQVAYSRRSPVTGEWEIWLLDLNGGHGHRFVTQGLFPEFHPGGDRIVFQRARKRDRGWFSIWVVRPDGSQEQEIIAGRDWGAANPTWSPDGRWIAFNSVGKTPTEDGLPAGGDDLWCVRADGEYLTRLTFRPTREWNPVWAADGRIYFNAEHDGEASIWSIAVEGLP